ncbi:MAG: hypothetical protein ACI4SG_01815 [Oligosphaeraceae bacterium]
MAEKKAVKTRIRRAFEKIIADKITAKFEGKVKENQLASALAVVTAELQKLAVAKVEAKKAAKAAEKKTVKRGRKSRKNRKPSVRLLKRFTTEQIQAYLAKQTE